VRDGARSRAQGEMPDELPLGRQGLGRADAGDREGPGGVQPREERGGARASGRGAQLHAAVARRGLQQERRGGVVVARDGAHRAPEGGALMLFSR
jgi:hypothetical protein